MAFSYQNDARRFWYIFMPWRTLRLPRQLNKHDGHFSCLIIAAFDIVSYFLLCIYLILSFSLIYFNTPLLLRPQQLQFHCFQRRRFCHSQNFGSVDASFTGGHLSVLFWYIWQNIFSYQYLGSSRFRFYALISPGRFTHHIMYLHLMSLRDFEVYSLAEASHQYFGCHTIILSSLLDSYCQYLPYKCLSSFIKAAKWFIFNLLLLEFLTIIVTACCPLYFWYSFHASFLWKWKLQSKLNMQSIFYYRASRWQFSLMAQSTATDEMQDDDIDIFNIFALALSLSLLQMK